MAPEQRTERRKEMHERFEKMSPEERKAMHEKMKEHWRNMPPEARAAHRKEMRERFEKMSPEERQQFERDMGKPCDGESPMGDCPAGKPDKPAVR